MKKVIHIIWLFSYLLSNFEIHLFKKYFSTYLKAFKRRFDVKKAMIHVFKIFSRFLFLFKNLDLGSEVLCLIEAEYKQVTDKQFVS